jgi:hypothetical protein
MCAIACFCSSPACVVGLRLARSEFVGSEFMCSCLVYEPACLSLPRWRGGEQSDAHTAQCGVVLLAFCASLSVAVAHPVRQFTAVCMSVSMLLLKSCLCLCVGFLLAGGLGHFVQSDVVVVLCT